jgi:hypothetical protein
VQFRTPPAENKEIFQALSATGLAMRILFAVDNWKEGIPYHEQILRLSIAFVACLYGGPRIWVQRAGG